MDKKINIQILSTCRAWNRRLKLGEANKEILNVVNGLNQLAAEIAIADFAFIEKHACLRFWGLFWVRGLRYNALNVTATKER